MGETSVMISHSGCQSNTRGIPAFEKLNCQLCIKQNRVF